MYSDDGGVPLCGAVLLHKHGPLAVDGQAHVVRAFDVTCSAIPDQTGPQVHQSSGSCGEMLGGLRLLRQEIRQANPTTYRRRKW